MKITKAVIPAAGLGTRFLPATKAAAQGNAANCGQAYDTIYYRGSRGIGHRKHTDHYRTGKEGNRRPFRQIPGAGV